MILVRKTMIDIIRYASENDSNFEFLCKNDKTKCFFNQYAKNFEDPHPEIVPFITGIRSQIGVMPENKETRCFIKISFPMFDIFCTHLEAYNRNIRLKQLEELKKHITRESIILGDFNIVDTQIYDKVKIKNKNIINFINKEYNYVSRINKIDNNNKKEIDIIKNEYKWIDAFEYFYNNDNENGDEKIYKYNNFFSDKINFTSWTNTVVDYIFFTENIFYTENKSSYILPNNIIPKIKIRNIFVHFNHHSDHLPIIIDIIDKSIKNATLKMTTKKNNEENNIYGDVKKTNLDNDKLIYFYNGQSLNTYNWYDLKEKKINPPYSFRDPMLTGNFQMLLGTGGVYCHNNPKYTQKYMRMFQEGLLDNDEKLNEKNKNENLNLNNCGLLYEWIAKENDLLRHDKNYGLDTKKFIEDNVDNKLYKTFDILNARGETLLMTNRLYDRKLGLHKIFRLNGIYICVVKISSDYNNQQIGNFCLTDEKIQNNFSYMIKEKMINSKRKDVELSDKYTQILLNAICYINNESKNNDDNINIDPDKIKDDMLKCDDDYIMFDLTKYTEFINKNSYGGYYFKYKNNKDKYEKIKMYKSNQYLSDN